MFGGDGFLAGGNLPGLPGLTGTGTDLQHIVKQMAQGQGDVADSLSQRGLPEMAVAQGGVETPNPGEILGGNTGQSSALLQQIMGFMR